MLMKMEENFAKYNEDIQAQVYPPYHRRHIARTKRKVTFFIWSIALLYISFTSANVVENDHTNSTNGARIVQRDVSVSEKPSSEANCTPPAIDDFPPDPFTQEERLHGFVAVYIFASMYIFYCLASVCDEYFVPSIECVVDDFQISSDVAGASLMAMATSSPELFTNIIGTFITKGDLGVGTVCGSAVFNILGVCACCGLASKNALPLEWYPLTRDSFFYFISVLFLIFLLEKRKVFWCEALVLVIIYILYLFVMYKNAVLRKWAENLQHRMSFSLGNVETQSNQTACDERIPFLRSTATQVVKMNVNFAESTSNRVQVSSNPSNQESHLDEEWSLVRPPFHEGYLIIIQWLLTWPARFAYAFTIPDCRKNKFRKFYPLTLLMCVVWIGILSYLISWTVSIVGYTFSIPDSVMGLTFLAVGNSVPEAVSSVIVARHGRCTMSISNSIGSNTFDILMCLGLPWLIRSSLIANDETRNYVHINSGGLVYSAMCLLASLVIIYFILACNRFYLDKKVGYTALTMYACFLAFACLVETNMFFTVNLPTCKTDY